MVTICYYSYYILSVYLAIAQWQYVVPPAMPDILSLCTSCLSVHPGIVTVIFECNPNIGCFYGDNFCEIPLLEVGLTYRIVTDSRAKTTEVLGRI